MKMLLLLSALLELPTGVALLAMPGFVADLLFGLPLHEPEGPTISRVAGAALLALGCACWGASRDVKSRAAPGVVAGMLIYNLGVAGVLGYGRYAGELDGVALIPVVGLHVALALGCISSLRARNPSS